MTDTTNPSPDRPRPADTAPESAPGVRWRLRMAAAERGVWTATQLRRLLVERAQVELSAASVAVLFTKQPTQVKLSTLTSLCTALDCAPGDLLVLLGAEPPGLLPVPSERTAPAAPASPTEPRRSGQVRPTGTTHRSLPPL